MLFLCIDDSLAIRVDGENVFLQCLSRLVAWNSFFFLLFSSLAAAKSLFCQCGQ